jgi:(1->4)-alpha-D-glucan 1-alpha-D-glucosylmutase
VRIPSATYRLQMNREFRFEDARKLVPYLFDLGITDIYSSPILKARKGSLHGYDVTDPESLNPELGTETDFDKLSEILQSFDMGMVLDIVPNHMAASHENPWWQDSIERGNDSVYTGYFDTDWLAFGDTEHYSGGYRRFFDIGDLVGIRIENPAVFKAVHSLILRFISERKITGLRIDHIDGLYNPLEYLVRLQETIQYLTGEDNYYLVVEKILSGDEVLPVEWPVSGTTGYDFTNRVNSLFISKDGISKLDAVYRQLTGLKETYSDIVIEKQKWVIHHLFFEEISALSQYLARLSSEADYHEIDKNSIMPVLVLVTACLPVYRTYIKDYSVSDTDRQSIERAFRVAGYINKDIDEQSLTFLKKVLLLEFVDDCPDPVKKEWLEFVLRWQQLTGAVMAKGVEDTALYNFHRLVSMNEVGGDPGGSGIAPAEFHSCNMDRSSHWPGTMNTTSTHDTKRSEDVRARINVLSEIPEEWENHLKKWMDLNKTLKQSVKGMPVPGPETEILLYQTMLGAWPLQESTFTEFQQRLKDYMIKAEKEAKSRTGWINPDNDYEEALIHFIEVVLNSSLSRKFLDDFLLLQQKTAFFGALNSLSQTLLKITSPGVPDLYQGNELWDFSLVDPDNRRPVDYELRTQLLGEIRKLETGDKATFVRQISDYWQDGRIKMYTIYKALHTRKDSLPLFLHGDYLPMEAEGNKNEHICAFARSTSDKWAVSVVPLFLTSMTTIGILPCGQDVWEEDVLYFPKTAPVDWENVFTGEHITLSREEKTLPLSHVFSSFPVALLRNR